MDRQCLWQIFEDLSIRCYDKGQFWSLSMVQYAIYEVQSLVGGLQSPVDDRAPEVRYLCALISELAYYHIPQWEVDDRKRAKLIPCEAYQLLVSRGRTINLITLLQDLDLPRGFVAVDRGVVAVGIVLNKILFIGFRGTQFLFDWKVNLRTLLTPIGPSFRLRGPYYAVSGVSGRLHSGFAEEAIRASLTPFAIQNLTILTMSS
jgi:hypothetical protein